MVSAVPAKPSLLVDTRVIYCGDNLAQLCKLPEACVDLIYIDPPFNSNRNYETPVRHGPSGAGRKRSGASKTTSSSLSWNLVTRK